MSTDFEITDEVREAWQFILTFTDPKWGCPAMITLIGAFRDCLAAKLRAEFEKDHVVILMRIKDSAPKLGDHCKKCGFIDDAIAYRQVDPRHSWQWAKWQAEANKELEGKS